MKRVTYTAYIEIDPNKRFGKPCLKGTRITVADLLEMMADGMTEGEILNEHPNISRYMIQAVLASASEASK